MVAAAKRVSLDNRDELDALVKARSAELWQADAWEYYDLIGEIKYAFTLVSNIVSRIRLYAARVDDPAQAPVPCASEGSDRSLAEAAAVESLRRLDSAYGGQPGLLRDAALNLLVAGEFNLVQMPANLLANTKETWDIRSVDELVVDASGVVTLKTRRSIDPGRGTNGRPVRVPPKAFIARIWRAHPRYSDDADSSMRGILELCAELLLLNRTFRATARSRLNSGMLYLPDGLSVAGGSDPGDAPLYDDDATDEYPDLTATADSDEDDFEEALVDAMTTPIGDEESAAAVVPLIIRGPADLADKIKIFKFERSFDPALAERSDRVLERIMQGIDVPKDLVTGLANVKYANAVQIDESLYKAHIEPLILLICDALTVVYLRPTLRALQIPEEAVERYVVWYDPSQVTTKTDRAQDADTGFDKFALSYETWRRAHGFSDDDAPTSTEIALRLMIERGSITPEMSEALLNVFIPEVMAKVRESTMEASPVPLDPAVAQALAGGQPSAAPSATSPAPESVPEQPTQPVSGPPESEIMTPGEVQNVVS